jgi:hypothetical protein
MRYFLANCEVPVWWDSKPKKASEVVASCTAIGSPNKGSYICDALAGIITCDPTVESIVTKALEAAAKYLWNEDVNSKEAFIETSDVYMETVFNKEIPIVGPENGGINDGVYYQSYAGKISGLLPTANAALFVPTGFLLDMMEGNSLDYDGNDGFVSVHSTKIGDFRGIIPTANWMLGGGADHAYQLNHFFGLTPGFDAKKFYIDLVAELKVKGY